MRCIGLPWWKGLHRYWILLIAFFMVVTTVITITALSPRQNVHAATGTLLATYLGSNARTGFNGSETTINSSTAASLSVQWSVQATGKISSQPLLVNGVLYWGAWDGRLHATNPTSGHDLWATSLGTKVGSCGGQSFGVVGTPTIANEGINGTTTTVIYVGAGQDNLYALDARTGTVLWKTNLGNSPAEIIYGSPAVYNGSVYIGVSSSGDCPLIQGMMYQVNASTGTIEHTLNFVPSGCIGVGIWDTPTIDESTGMLYVGTGNADPINCKTTEPLASSLVELSTSDLSLVSSWQFTPTGTTDADIGSTPTLFQATIGGTLHQMVGLESKDGNYYAFDRSNIGGGPLWKVAISVGGRNPELGLGSIASSAFDGTTLYVAGGNTKVNGTACQGSLRALNPSNGSFLWEVCRSNPALDSVIAVPGLVVVGAGNTMIVVDASTGKVLFSYQDTSSNAKFWGSASIVNGVLYYGSRSGNLFAFWTGKSGPGPRPSPSPSPTASPPPNPVTGPVNKTWYFAEGKVGAGFTEYLTIENPDKINDCTVNIEYLLGSGSPVNKAMTVPHSSRSTESVNADLNISPSGNQLTDSAVVTVTNPTTCAGVVAERPMYFTNFNGVSSGSDVLGSTHTGTSFYFADVPTGGGYASFITVLNPGTTTANITAAFDVGGTTVNTLTLQVPGGTRGTLIPNNSGALHHAAVIVTSDHPVVVERPDYFGNINAGNAQTVSGASSVVGVQSLKNDWLFAEGYTGGGFQEYLVLANFGTAPVTASVMLEFSNGHTETITPTIQPRDQTFVDVNGVIARNLGTCDTSPCQPTQDVSAEVSGNGNFIAQREMFFHYTHIGDGRSLSATGGSDVIGEGAPAVTAYSFAEGYTNTGYDEWLTVQNPTANTETINIRLVNEDGRSFTQGFTVVAHSRFTVDITGMIIHNLIVPNDTYKGYEVSMTIQSTGGVFVAERPMYWNTGGSGTQGGSDVIGYIGN